MEDKVTRKLEQKKREKQLLHDVEWLMKRVPELLPQEVRAPAFRRDDSDPNLTWMTVRRAGGGVLGA